MFESPKIKTKTSVSLWWQSSSRFRGKHLCHLGTGLEHAKSCTSSLSLMLGFMHTCMMKHIQFTRFPDSVVLELTSSWAQLNTFCIRITGKLTARPREEIQHDSKEEQVQELLSHGVWWRRETSYVTSSARDEAWSLKVMLEHTP